ncbi:ABC transporter permease [Thermostaphylospora chromogena]|uniref:Transport permease protein n=1 Tax=Thermostaphylospora chromogena TaxID=35622 RepID=A0A1H1EW33_9ACTN|nr:ABC transporter permease [Thermostaphylospora chromogena]SDQ92931.1 ABC-2 type transport system permease protein [Thermostaphylospora chromogena]
MRLLTHTGIVFAREIAPELRAPAGMVFGMIQPFVFLLLFGPLLSGMPGMGGSVWQWFVPGILIMQSLYGPASAGYYLLVEGTSGSLERMLVTPLSRSAMLIGRALKEIVTLLVQASIIVLALLPFGFRPHPVGAVTGLMVLVVLGIGLGGLSFALAIAARRSPSLFWGVQQTALFPMMLLSGVFLPMDDAPAVLRALSAVNPLTHVVEAERALFNGHLIGGTPLAGALTAVGVAVVGLLVGIRSMRRASL